MKRPPFKTRIIGHPGIAGPVTLASGIATVAGLYNGSAVPLFIAAPVAMAVLKANEQVVAWRRWSAEWEAMAPNPSRKRTRMRDVLVLVAIIAAVITTMQMDSDTRQMAATIIGLLVGVGAILFVLHKTVRWISARRRHRAGPFTVTVIGRPVMPVPSLHDAYRALPPYCQALLGARS